MMDTEMDILSAILKCRTLDDLEWMIGMIKRLCGLNQKTLDVIARRRLNLTYLGLLRDGKVRVVR